jgi:hypothetical protein
MPYSHIHVTFIDADTQMPFAQSEVPLDRLPETFEMDTTMHLGDDDWHVVKADPLTTAEFAQTGKLVLTLAKVQQVSPKDILYSLPTLNNDLPRVIGGAQQGQRIFTMHEDDWRQIEFISTTHTDAIHAQIGEIRRIFDEESVQTERFTAFRRLFVRKEIPAPIADPLPLAQVQSLFAANSTSYDGLAIGTTTDLVEGGFALDLAGIVLYGQQHEGNVTALGLAMGSGGSANPATMAGLFAALMRQYSLSLVDWCSMLVLPADSDLLDEYLHALIAR